MKNKFIYTITATLLCNLPNLSASSTLLELKEEHEAPINYIGDHPQQDRIDQARQLYILGVGYKSMGQLEKAKSSLIEANDIYRMAKDDKYPVKLSQIVKMKTDLVDIYIEIGDYIEALKYCEDILCFSQDQGLKSGIAEAHKYKGNIYLKQRQHVKAVQSYYQELILREELEDWQGLTECFKNIGLANHRMGEYQRAIKYYDITISLLDSSSKGIEDKDERMRKYIEKNLVRALQLSNRSTIDRVPDQYEGVENIRPDETLECPIL